MIRVVEKLATEEQTPNRLSVSVAAGEGETSAAVFSDVKEALLEWQRSGRSTRGILEIEIQTEESMSMSALQEFMNTVSATDPQIYEFYRGLKDATVRTVSPSGKRIKTIGFAH
jgi:hypothetical protein